MAYFMTSRIRQGHDPQASHAPGADVGGDRRLADAAGRAMPLVAMAALVLALVVLYRQTFGSMLGVWTNSSTFFHGFFVAPASLYLVWRRREALAGLRPRPCWSGLAVMTLLSLGWLLADALGVQAGAQFAAVALIPASVVTIYGPAIAGRIAFPLGFLFFAVPFGEFLIPYLIDFTAAFTVKALNLTGIPVIREGRFFAIPSGKVEVARACSGIRYLLAAVALGTIFAYVDFTSVKKRILFVGISFLWPILANGVRAYCIVLLAHFSDMSIAVGVDHILFGWIFFGIVVSVLFLIGARFHDLPGPSTAGRRHGAARAADGESTPTDGAKGFGLAAVMAVAAMAVGPVLAGTASVEQPPDPAAFAGLPQDIPGWARHDDFPDELKPAYRGASRSAFATFGRGDSTMYVALLQYAGRRQDSELANSENSVTPSQGQWKLADAEAVTVEGRQGSAARYWESEASGAGRRLLIGYWYLVGPEPVQTATGIKLAEAAAYVTRRATVSSVVIVTTILVSGGDDIPSSFRDFIAAAYPAVNACIESGAATPGCDVGRIEQEAKDVRN